jgi:hypothetical protein
MLPPSSGQPSGALVSYHIRQYTRHHYPKDRVFDPEVKTINAIDVSISTILVLKRAEQLRRHCGVKKPNLINLLPRSVSHGHSPHRAR